MNFTADQQRVIDTRNSNILVSAAAGSGKTAVLVERIIQRITDKENPVDIDRLLIVTFTSAAAAQMRERISKAVAKGLEEQPENEHLQRQASLIHNAQITTIDSFCLFVIRNHFNEIGIDPAFRVADESEIKMLEADVMDRLLEEKHTEPSPRFLRFVECYGTGTSEKRIEEAILRLYHFSMSYPFPEEWLLARLDDYRADDAQKLSKQGWFQEALRYIDTILTECEERLRQALAIAGRADGPAQYVENLVSDLELIETLKEAKDYEALYDLFTYSAFTRLSAKKTQGEDPVLKETVKRIRDDVKKSIANLKKQLFQISVEDMLRDMAVCQEAVEELAALTLSFKEMLDDAKRDKNIIDFSDMEHFALQILLEKNEKGEIVPRETALALREYFAEIMIDEYQDSNEVQELLLKSISGEGSGRFNRFMVGDVKQSIYKFRLARPEIFMEKYDTYVINKGDEETPQKCVRIDLSMNFRSRREVTDAVNFICGQLMRKSVGNVEYDENAALYAGASYPAWDCSAGENPYQTELLIAGEPLEEEEEYSAKEREALLVAERIKKLVGRFPVTDAATGEQRPAKYSDIVILFRATAGWDEDFRRVLSENRIPVHVTSRTGYFDTLEIQGLVNFLRVLDNPLQDIAFFGVMRLPFLDFCEEEIARIRCFAKEGGENGGLFLYEQVKLYAENADAQDALQNKVKRLLEMLSDYRKRVVYTPIKELIRALIDETGYGAYVGSMPGGDQRLANLNLLLEKAGAFQNTSFYGLFHFIRYLETIQEQEVEFGEANILDENADVVRIMTIHKSKGLEFPICFVCGLSKQFNMLDMRQAILMDAELGVGVDYIDPDMRIKRRNIRKNVVAQRMKEDTRGEDLRVLYVALTRAKEKLILTGYAADFDKKLQADLFLTMEEEGKLPYSVMMGAGSYLDLVLASLIRHTCMQPLLEERGFSFVPHAISYGEVPIKAAFCTKVLDLREELASQGRSAMLEQELDRASLLADIELQKTIEDRMEFSYPYAYLEGLTVKTTVSELKRVSYEETFADAARLIVPDKEETYVPDFAKETQAGADAQAAQGGVRFGTAVHKVMELLSFGKEFSYQSLEDEKRLYAVIYEARRSWIAEGRVTENELACVPVGKICGFFKSPLASRMIAASERGELYKEQPFVLGVGANQLSGQYPEDELVLIQGVIDVFFYEDGGIVFADYKTDRVEDEKQLADRYRAQLDYYQRALEQITGKRVKERYLYSFYLQKEILI